MGMQVYCLIIAFFITIAMYCVAFFFEAYDTGEVRRMLTAMFMFMVAIAGALYSVHESMIFVLEVL